MALIEFQIPERAIQKELSGNHGKYEFGALEPGFGLTIGNALRRVLLSSLEGYAINSIKIDGVEHEFSTVNGVFEDVTNIILNLKKIRLRKKVEDATGETAIFKVEGPGNFTAADLSKELSFFEVINQKNGDADNVIFQVTEKVAFNMQITIDKGRGYIPADEIAESFEDKLQIAIDAIYTPIVNVQYKVEPTRKGQRTDYDNLIIEVDTDGSITPLDALRDAAKLLIDHFDRFASHEVSIEQDTKPKDDTLDENLIHVQQLLRTKLSDDEYKLSVRALNCLKAAKIETIGDLVRRDKSQLLKVKNFGKKSLQELEELLEHLELNFGMDTSKYKLD